jgi:hypothetical protein
MMMAVSRGNPTEPLVTAVDTADRAAVWSGMAGRESAASIMFSSPPGRRRRGG